METLVFLNKLEDTNIITIKGKATMNTSKTISDMIELLLNHNEKVALNMTDCKYIDSTFLGLIAEATMKSNTVNGAFIKVLNPNSIVLASLNQTGIINFIETENVDNLYEKINLENPLENKTFDSKIEHSKFVLEMHKILSELNEQNKEMFKSVISQMEFILKNYKD